MNEHEYDCRRCGIRVWLAIPGIPEHRLCPGCHFVESIHDKKAQKEVALALDRINEHSQESAT